MTPIAKARALLAEKSETPWRVRNNGDGTINVLDANGWSVVSDAAECDAPLIAAAPTLLAELCDALERAEQDTAERIAAWLESECELLDERAARIRRGHAERIRSGAWRKP